MADLAGLTRLRMHKSGAIQIDAEAVEESGSAEVFGLWNWESLPMIAQTKATRELRVLAESIMLWVILN